jgi:phenol hydroxylase P3 protein
MPPQQIFQGNCGGASLEDVLKWYRLNQGEDNMDYVGSPDEKRWKQWKGMDTDDDATKTGTDNS